MATDEDVFYANCTFWTGDWNWLAAMNHVHQPPRPQVRVVDRFAVGAQGRKVRIVEQPQIPTCPFCGSVGFEINRATWMRMMQEYQDGMYPNAPGVMHPGYVAMMLWGEKKCFQGMSMLERAWISAGKPGILA